MDVKTLLASAPLIRRAWRVVPGPLRIPLVLVAAVVWFVKRGDGDDTGSGAGPGGAAADHA